MEWKLKWAKWDIIWQEWIIMAGGQWKWKFVGEKKVRIAVIPHWLGRLHLQCSVVAPGWVLTDIWKNNTIVLESSKVTLQLKNNIENKSKQHCDNCLKLLQVLTFCFRINKSAEKEKKDKEDTSSQSFPFSRDVPNCYQQLHSKVLN